MSTKSKRFNRIVHSSNRRRGGGASTADDLIATYGHLSYDASDISTLWQNSGHNVSVTADSDPVYFWDDKLGNGNMIAAGSGQEFVYNTGVFNGGTLPSVQSDGINDDLTATYAMSHDVIFIMVVKINSSAGYATVAAGRSNNFQISSKDGTYLGAYGGVGGYPKVLSWTQTIQYQEVFFNGASPNSYIRYNDVTDTGATDGTTAWTGLKLGRYTTGIHPVAADYGRVLALDGSIPSADLDTIRTSVRATWGV